MPRLLVLCVMLWTGVAARGEDRALEDFFRSYLDELFAMRPLTATYLGDHRFDALLDDVSTEARERWLEHARRTLRELPRRVNRARLSRDGQIDFEILRNELRLDVWLAENTRPFEEDPRTYNHYITDSVYLLLAQSTLPESANVANAIARMRQIPRVIETARASIRRPPREHTETAIRQNRGAIAFYEGEILNFVRDPANRETLARAAEPVAAALRDYHAFLESEVLPRADGNWRLGRRRFARKLDLVLNADVSAAEVLEDARAEFERVRNEMYVIARQLWHRHFPSEPVPPSDEEGRRETIERVLRAISRDHGTAASLTDDVRRTVDDVKRFIADRGILRLPDPDRCEIVEMPEFQRGNSTAYMNSPPPLDPNATAYYAVSPPPADWDEDRVRSYLEEYNHHMLRILTVHEAYPGHYVQLEYANRQPSLIRRVLGSGVYIEGWAVYTEQMMLDQGYGDGDLALRLTQLKFYLRAVANAILDHLMHCEEMTDDEAMDLLVRQSFQSEGEARLKVIRAKQSSV